MLVVRESPLSEIHLENMLKLARMGVTILPPMPGFYNHPTSVGEMVDHIVMRILDQFGIHIELSPRWDGKMVAGEPDSGRYGVICSTRKFNAAVPISELPLASCRAMASS